MTKQIKKFSEFWPIISMFVYILVGWSVLSIIVALISMNIYSSVFTTIPGLLITIAVFAYLGYVFISDHKQEVGTAAKAGALVGIIAGFAGAVLSIVSFYLVPQIYAQAIETAVAQGVAEEMIMQWTVISLYVGLVLSPLINAGIGALISSVSALITKKLSK